jgi:hypothetical protein
MRDATHEFSTGDFTVTIEAPARLAFMRLVRDTGQMSGAEMAELSRRLVDTRRALAAAGYQVRYVGEPRRACAAPPSPPRARAG